MVSVGALRFAYLCKSWKMDLLYFIPPLYSETRLMASLTFVDMTTESPTKPLMALGKIPSVDIIKEHLGLNAAPVKVKNEFRDMTVEWRKKSIMSNSRPATDLVDWHSPAVQKDLYTLAETFLADKENAERFWSASRPWKYDSELQYPDDKKRYSIPSGQPP